DPGRGRRCGHGGGAPPRRGRHRYRRHRDSAPDPRRRVPRTDRPDGGRGRGGAPVKAVAYELSDMWVLAVRSAKRIPRQPDLLIGFTVQPLMFVLLFVYVFGGAIVTPGYTYVDYLIPGIVVQTIAFGGFVTALGLTDDLKKGLMDRFRSLPMSRAAVLTGRTLADISTNTVQ